ncbi:hypothetical protein [Gimesia chilikensis]|uniref:hypothetical protein n=1 Tax=Gimesia chilikensis TaxID=2605989 RepID=UPI003A8EFB72
MNEFDTNDLIENSKARGAQFFKFWLGFIAMLFLMFCMFFAEPHRHDSLNLEMERVYSGFYNRGYEAGYEDAKAGRERDQKYEFKFESGAGTDAEKQSGSD